MFATNSGRGDSLGSVTSPARTFVCALDEGARLSWLCKATGVFFVVAPERDPGE